MKLEDNNNEQNDCSHTRVGRSRSDAPAAGLRLIRLNKNSSATVPLTYKPVPETATPSTALTAKATEVAPKSEKNGWTKHSDPASGLILSCPAGWEFMSPNEVKAKTHGQFDFTKRTILFCVNMADFDQNLNIIYRPDVSQFASTKEEARALLEQQLPNQAESAKKNGRTLISSRVCDLAGGVALETYVEGTREQIKMKQRLVTIIVNKKYFVITFTAKGDFFNEVNKTVFDPMLAGMTIK